MIAAPQGRFAGDRDYADRDLLMITCDQIRESALLRVAHIGEDPLSIYLCRECSLHCRLIDWEITVGVARRERGLCPSCSSGEVTHVLFGFPANPGGEPDWVRFGGCVIHGVPNDRRCETCGHSWVAPGHAGRFWVYVIELDPDALGDKDQHAELGHGALYVGYTSKKPPARLLQHQAAGHLAARVFKKMKNPRASWLRMDLSLYAGPHANAADARRAERRTHNRLKSDGYQVFGDKGRKLSIPPASVHQQF